MPHQSTAHRNTYHENKTLKRLCRRCLKLALIVPIMAAGALAQTIDTRLGKLNFENGFPTEETTRKLFDEMDYQRAVQAL